MLKKDESVILSMNYAEYIVNVKCEGKILVKKLLTIIFFLLLFIIGTWAVCGGIIYTPPLEILVIAICFIGYFFARGYFNIEYEYIVASAMIEFDAIYGQRKRREIITVSLDKAERIAPYNNSNAQYIKNKAPEKVYDFCSSKNSKRRYFILFYDERNGKNTVIYFDAISKTLDVIKFFRSQIVEIDKDIYNM